MRFRHLVLPLAVVIASCEEPTEPTAPVDPASAPTALASTIGGAPAFVVNGSGHTGPAGERRTFSFSARADEDGNARGEFQLFSREADVRLHGRILCVAVSGRTAWIGGTILTGEPYEGDDAFFRVADLGSGNSAGEPDRLSLLQVGPPGTAAAFCDSRPSDPPLSLPVRGNITVHAPGYGNGAVGIPDQVTDLSVAAVTDTSATLAWTAVSDGRRGSAAYWVRASIDPSGPEPGDEVIEGSCGGLVDGPAAGEPVTCRVSGLLVGTRYFFDVVAVRTVGPDSPARGEPSNVASAYTDFLENFSRFSAGDVPTAPHGDFVYTTNDGFPGVEVKVAEGSGALADRPLVLSKASAQTIGAPNFWFQRTVPEVIMDVSSGSIRIAAEIQVNGGAFCSFFNFRGLNQLPASVWLHELDYTVGVPFTVALTMDVDAGIVSATQDGTPVPVHAVTDSGDRISGLTVPFAHLPWRVGFEGCTTNGQEMAVDDIRIEAR